MTTFRANLLKLLRRLFRARHHQKRVALGKIPGFNLPALTLLVLLGGIAGYIYRRQGSICYRRAALHFNPNTRIGTADFKLLHAELSNQQGGPGCVHYNHDLLLIQTSATHFEDLIAYSRRLASPNDQNLTAVFVRDTIAGQPWRVLAHHPFHRVNQQVVIPPNWVAHLAIYQGGLASAGPQATLVDTKAFLSNGESRVWRATTNYAHRAVTEELHYGCPNCDTLPMQTVYRTKRRLVTTDAAFYSPYRLRQGF